MRLVFLALLLAMLAALAGCAMSDDDARAAKARWERFTDEEDDIY